MGARTSGREAALQMLYAFDSGETEDVSVLMADYWSETPGDPEGRSYADDLVRGVLQEMEPLDELIRSASKHWRLERMSRVDRNLLRIGAYELKAQSDVPRPVVIDEAVELAKRYGAEGSSVFVNGVLDRIAELLGR